ncbi:DoxX family protein [Nocardiopsis potens]|uniref:DoxX family protein n=1 Tax=Nocardiopsis potens TaxID=1246458 RepID=UPI00034C29FE|nr:DoxX family protein [Nocardiopsis potens]
MERTAQHPAAGRATALTVLAWVLQVLCFAAFAMFGSGKLLGWPDHVQVFEEIGMGQWLRYAVGAAEVAGALLLLVPRLAGLAALGLAVIVVGAVLTHLFILVDSGWTTPAVLTVLLLAVAWIRKRETLSLIGR